MIESDVRSAVIYGRNSSAKQKSIDDQQAENRAATQAHGWQIVAELDDPSSASRYATKVRKNWIRLLGLLPEVDIVVLWEPSRGDRSLTTWASFLDACREHRVRIHATMHQRTYDPRIARDYRNLAEDGIDSAYESDKISARVIRGQASAAAAGLPHSTATYGYRRRYDPVTRVFLAQEPHPEQADVVRDIITSIAGGEPLLQVMARLNAAGVPAPRGGATWHHSVVRGIARNQAYRPHPEDPDRGVRVYGDALYVAQWPPLVTETQWQAARAVLGVNPTSRRDRRNSAPGQIKYLVSGNPAVMTATCGSMLTGSRSARSRGATYSCWADRCASAPMPEVDEFVTRLVVARLSRKDARRLWVVDDSSAVQAAGEELARLLAELEAARQSFYRPGGISAEALAGKESAMAGAIADARRRAQPTGVPLAALELVEAGKFGAERVRVVWDSFPLLARREVIAGLFDRLTLGPATVRLTRWTPADERLDVVADRISHEWRGPTMPEV